MRRNLIGVVVVLAILGGFLALRRGGQHVVGVTLDQMLATLPPGTTATHGATDYDPLGDTLTVHDLVLNRAGRKAAFASVVTVTGARLKALQAVFDPNAYPDGRPAWTDRRPLLGHVDIKALEIEPATPDGQALTVRHVVLDQLSGRPFIRPPTLPNRSAPDFQADAMEALSFQSYAAEGIALTSQGPGQLSIGQFTMTGYDRGTLADYTIKGIDFALPAGKPPVTFSLANIDIKGIDLRAVVAALAAFAGEDPVARRKTMASAYAAMKVQTFDLDGLALKLSPGPRIGLASLHSDNSGAEGGVRRGSMALSALSIAADDTVMPAATHGMLQRFGSDRLVLDEDGEGAWNEPAHHFDLNRLDLTARDLGVLHLAASLDGVDRAALRSQDKAARRAALMNVAIVHLSAGFDDKSLVGRIIGVLAMQQNIPPEQVRAAAAMPLAALSVLIPDQPDAAAQISAFLDHPHSLRITLDPPSPVSLAQVSSLPMPERAHALGLKIEAK
jgi:hypothetical protein